VTLDFDKGIIAWDFNISWEAQCMKETRGDTSRSPAPHFSRRHMAVFPPLVKYCEKESTLSVVWGYICQKLPKLRRPGPLESNFD